MSEQSNVPARLREGIDAAKRGDKTTARRLLQQVLSIDGDNELALMWMASVVDSLNERRFFLERALSINPKNDRAREALRRLGVTEPSTVRQAPPPPPSGEYMRRTNGNNTNIYLVAAAVVGFIVVAVIVASAVSSLQPTPTPIVPQNAQLTFQAILNPTSTATADTRSPTPTVFQGVVVTLDTSLFTPLPATFTPTATFTPVPTGSPTPTPLPLKSFTMIYSDTEQGAAQPSLYQGAADGSGEVKLQSGDAGGFLELAYDPSGQRLAFVRTVDDGSGNVAPQLFVAPFSSLGDAKQITKLTGSTLSHPSWSPDGTKIVFATNDSGAETGATEEAGGITEQIAVINPDGTGYQALTSNGGRNYDPAYSPDGKLIVFASDMDSPGFTEIYTMTVSGGDITQLTNVPNSYSPSYSPDGTKIAFVNDQQGDGDIYVMDADGERPVLLTVDDNGAEDHSPSWSPDGRWIIFASNRDGSDQFRWYAIDMQGNAQPVTVTGRNPQSLSFITH